MKKEKLQFKVGDIVKITDFGKIYSTYESMFVKMGFKKRNFNDGSLVDVVGKLGVELRQDEYPFQKYMESKLIKYLKAKLA